MKIIPALDIKDGKCTQLVGGRAGTETFYGDPLEAALKWENAGAEILHVIDLDATLGLGSNLNIVLKIMDSLSIPIQFGGGVRDKKTLLKLMDAGVEKVIVGTLAIQDYLNGLTVIRELGDYKGRIIAAVDSRGGNVVVKGWREKTNLKAFEVMNKMQDHVWGFLYTDVDIEGQMRGVRLENIKEAVKATKNPVIISGGISSKKDVEDIEKTGAWGVILGKALYEGRFDIKELFKKNRR